QRIARRRRMGLRSHRRHRRSLHRRSAELQIRLLQREHPHLRPRERLQGLLWKHHPIVLIELSQSHVRAELGTYQRAPSSLWHVKVSVMSTAAPWQLAEERRMSLDEWASLPEDEPGELVDGLLVEEEVADWDHEDVVAWLMLLLGAWVVARG